MLLTITSTQSPATDLGFLLHKNPGRLQYFDLTFGRAVVFYPQADEQRCTAALLLEIDPVTLVRGKKDSNGESSSGPLQSYVNDRPYVASSFLSVAIAQVFGSALAGKSKTHSELAETNLPLAAHLAVLPSRGGDTLIKRLFEPLGYRVTTQDYPLDSDFPEWGESRYFSVTLEASCRLKDLLSHLYVLVPVLDEEKHYWFGDDEVEKLLRHGEGWLAAHPEKNLITGRYLKRRYLVQQALDRLIAEEIDVDIEPEEHTLTSEAALEAPVSLNEQRMAAVVNILKQQGVKRVLDLGCGEGKLLQVLLADSTFEEIVGMDVAYRSLEKAKFRLHLENLPTFQQARIKLIQGNLNYRDKRLSGFQAATVIEVIEHLDPARLAAFERVLFEFAQPQLIIITAPNFEYNRKFEGLPAGELRHPDHRFEWTRAQFREWSTGIAERFEYVVRFLPVGPADPDLGPPTQMAIFTH